MVFVNESFSASQKTLLTIGYLAQMGIVLFDIEWVTNKKTTFRSLIVFIILYLLPSAQTKEAFLLLVASASLFLNLYVEGVSPQWKGLFIKNTPILVTVLFYAFVCISFLPILPPNYAIFSELMAFLVLGLEEYFLSRRSRNHFAYYTRIIIYVFSLTIYFKNFISTSAFMPELKMFFEVVVMLLLLFLFLQFIFQKEDSHRKSIFSSIFCLFLFWSGMFLEGNNYYLLILIGVLASWSWASINYEKTNAYDSIMFYAVPGSAMFAPFIAILAKINIDSPARFLFIWPIVFAIVWIFVALHESEKKIEIKGPRQWALVAIALIGFILLIKNPITMELF
ncbi:MAG: hypothetical protein IPM57_04360 [Oligoflexia bacterium]|nr:hypothetical protein [Oligoflexia bacterium]